MTGLAVVVRASEVWAVSGSAVRGRDLNGSVCAVSIGAGSEASKAFSGSRLSGPNSSRCACSIASRIADADSQRAAGSNSSAFATISSTRAGSSGATSASERAALVAA